MERLTKCLGDDIVMEVGALGKAVAMWAHLSSTLSNATPLPPIQLGVQTLPASSTLAVCDVGKSSGRCSLWTVPPTRMCGME